MSPQLGKEDIRMRESSVFLHFATFGTLVANTSTIGRPMMVVYQFQGIHSKGTRMSRFILSALAIVGVLALGSGAAFAQHGHHGGGHSGHHGGGHSGHYGGGHHGGGHYGVGHAIGHTVSHVGGHYGGAHYGGYVYSAPSYSYAPQYASVVTPSCSSSYRTYTPVYQSYAPAYAPVYSSGHVYHAPSVHVHATSGHYNHHRTGHHH
jgi:hypothetical protein